MSHPANPQDPGPPGREPRYGGASLPDDPEAQSSEASLLFESFLQSPEVTEDRFQSFCREHPGQVEGLQELWRFHRVRRELGFLDSIAELFGRDPESGFSPTISLPGIDAASGAPTYSSGVLDSLGGRSGSFERYAVREELGRGAMGVVRRAWDSDLRRHLAIKTLSPRFASAINPACVDSRKLCRFVEEAQVTAQLDHPGIVPIHEIGFDPEGRVYFTMKLVEGSTLEDVLASVHGGDPNWTVTRVLGILTRVCEALAYAHTKGVLHRDLKPANIMVGRFGEVFIMDWGLARVLSQLSRDEVEPLPGTEDTGRISTERQEMADETPGSALYTQEGGVVGTPAFMSPEQARGDLENIGPPSDVFALGSILYVLLTGELPYAKGGEVQPAMTVLHELRKGPPTPIHELAPETSPELIAICERAMERKIEDRYPNTAELMRDITAYLEGHVVHAYRTGAWQELTKWVRRNTGMAASLVAALVAGVAALIVLTVFVRGQERTQRRELLMSAESELAELTQAAPELWPPHPELNVSYERWLERADALTARAPGFRAELDGSDAGKDALYAEALASLVEDLDAFADPVTGTVDGADASSGWGVRKRAAWARRIAERSIEGSDARGRWNEAVQAIAASPLYGGLELQPQMGLVPLGPDPRSGLFEFAHLQSGPAAERDSEGQLRGTGQSGLVLVLLPGGVYRRPIFEAARVSGHMQPVELAPFFLSKFEMTLGQWERATTTRAGAAADDPEDLPVHSVSWTNAAEVLHQLGLALPTTVQWSYAGMGSAETRWHPGNEVTRLGQYANLADASFAASFERGRRDEYTREVDDGFATHAPVGSFEPNVFGLHDIHGNVWEWTADRHLDAARPLLAPTGRYAGADPEDPLASWRGGGWGVPPAFAGFDVEDARPKKTIHNQVGLRPARELDVD